MKHKDAYQTISKACEGEMFKDKNSKFIGFAFPVTTEAEIKTHIEAVKKDHYAARHWCYAYQIGTETLAFRANDDGEPNNSAGMPIYGQIQSFNLTNVLIVVVRYYGGVKLGVSGLITAYKTAAKLALEQSNIITKTINNSYTLTFEYKDMSKVLRLLNDLNAEIISQDLQLNCNIRIEIRKGDAQACLDVFTNFYGVSIKEEAV